MKSYTEMRMEKEAAERKLRLAQRQLKLVVHEHSKLLEKHRLMTSTKDTLLEELKTVRSAANIMERDLKEQVYASFLRTYFSCIYGWTHMQVCVWGGVVGVHGWVC